MAKIFITFSRKSQHLIETLLFPPLRCETPCYFSPLLLFFLFGLCNDSQKLARNGFRYIIFISVFLV